MAVAGWGPDFPTGLGFYNSIVNGENILPTGNSNYASLNDPAVNKVLDDAPAGKATEQDWVNARPRDHGRRASTCRTCSARRCTTATRG